MRHAVTYLDDWFVLPQVPDDTAAGLWWRQDVLHLTIPRHPRHVVRRLQTTPTHRSIASDHVTHTVYGTVQISVFYSLLMVDGICHVNVWATSHGSHHHLVQPGNCIIICKRSLCRPPSESTVKRHLFTACDTVWTITHLHLPDDASPHLFVAQRTWPLWKQ